MIDISAISEHMEVVGSDGQHVGTVDHLDTTRIKLTKTDPAAGGEHHYLPFSAVQAVKDGRVVLSMSAEVARTTSQTEGPQPAR